MLQLFKNRSGRAFVPIIADQAVCVADCRSFHKQIASHAPSSKRDLDLPFLTAKGNRSQITGTCHLRRGCPVSNGGPYG